MYSLCRLCANYTVANDLTTEVSAIESKLKLCCGWKPLENGVEMPNKACKLCVEKLQYSWDFAESVWSAEKQLLKLSSEVNQQIDAVPVPPCHTTVDGTIDYDSIKFEPDVEEAEENDQDFDMELFVEPIIKSDSDSAQPKKTPKRSKKSTKKRIKTSKTTCESFMAAIGKNECLTDGTIRADAVVRLEKLFPEMKTMIWSECEYICKKCDKVMKSPQKFYAHNRSFHLEETPNMDFFCFYCNSKHKRKLFSFSSI